MENLSWNHCLGKDLAPYRIGKHSNPQNRPKNTSNIDLKKTRFSVFFVYFCPVLLVGAFSCSVGGQVFRNHCPGKSHFSYINEYFHARATTQRSSLQVHARRDVPVEVQLDSPAQLSYRHRSLKSLK